MAGRLRSPLACRHCPEVFHTKEEAVVHYMEAHA